MYVSLIRFLITERLNHLFFGIQSGPQWCRVVMDRETDRLINGLDKTALSVLEISGRKWAQGGFKSYRHAEFPDFDLCEERLDSQFDLIIAEQVFEHLKKPYRAAINVLEMLKPGGHFLVTTPFMIKIHDFPIDCTRWSEMGMRNFLEESGFNDEIKTGSWGNRKCLVSNLNQWTQYNPRMHSLENESDVPLVVWAFAKKG